MPELLHPGVYVQEVSSGVRPIEGVSTSTAAFIGVADKGPIPGTILPNDRVAEPVMVTSLTEYFRRFGGFRRDSFLTYAVRAFYENGGRRIYIVRVAPKTPEKRNGLADPVSPLAATGKLDELMLSAATEGTWGNNLFVDAEPSEDDDKKFKLLVYYGETQEDAVRNLVETIDGLDTRSTETTYFKTVVNSRSEFIAIKNPTPTKPSEEVKKAPSKKLKKENDKVTVFPPRLDGGTPGTGNVDFIGEAAKKETVTGTGLFALDKVTDVNLIAIPGRGNQETINAGMQYCKNRPLQDCFFIGDVGMTDPPAARAIGHQPSVRQIGEAVAFAGNKVETPINKSFGDYGAIYYPWIHSADPLGGGPNPRILLPPSPFLAGIFARVDNSRGVFKAPAGTTDAGVAGALSVATTVSDIDQDRLNPIGVNVVRTVPTAGIVVWGTRTIGSDAEWRYIPVRRMAIFLRVSIYYGIQWAVFEPNDFPLWASLTLNIESFMLTQFRAGAFQGRTPDDAFFVRCDDTTTTQQDIDNGVVNILVGFAPLKPAEFVVLKLSQKVNQPAA